jgi:hypothetical protein
MRILVANYLIARLRMAFYGYLIGHGTAWAENGSFHPKKGGGINFQVIYAGILAKNIVSQWSFLHEIQHGSGWTGYCVGTEVDCHAANLGDAVIL